MKPVVRRLTGDTDDNEIVAVSSRAFWDDPLFDFLADGDLLTEYRVLPHVFRAAMTDFRRDESHRYVSDVAGRPRAFAGWLGPGTFPRSRTDASATRPPGGRTSAQTAEPAGRRRLAA